MLRLFMVMKYLQEQRRSRLKIALSIARLLVTPILIIRIDVNIAVDPMESNRNASTEKVRIDNLVRVIDIIVDAILGGIRISIEGVGWGR
jgi:hypothetical protein